MLTEEEKKFIEYWKANRDRKKKSIWQFSVGLPLGVLIIVAVFVNLSIGWYQRADMQLRSNISLIIVILIAAVGIVVFISFYSARHQWDQNEQRYLELLNKSNNRANTTSNT